MNTLFTNTTKTVSARFLAAVTAFAMILSAFPAAFFVAEASAPVLIDSATEIDIVADATEEVGPNDASAFTNVMLAFDYDLTGGDSTSDGLEDDDELVYGYSIGGTKTELDSIPGASGTNAGEIGSVSGVALPADSDLTIYFEVRSAAGTDNAKVTNVSITGESIEDDTTSEPLTCTVAPTFNSDISSGSTFDWNFSYSGDVSAVDRALVFYDGVLDRPIANDDLDTIAGSFLLRFEDQPVAELEVKIYDEDDQVIASCIGPLQPVDENPDEPAGTSAINVCKIIVDENGDITDTTPNGNEFSIDISGPDGYQQPVSFYGQQFTPDTDLVSENGDSNDAMCELIDGLAAGNYLYAEEVISGGGDWETPLYHDYHTETPDSIADFGEMFPEGTPGEKNNDGSMQLEEGETRTLAIVNTLKEPEIPELEIPVRCGEVVDEFTVPADSGAGTDTSFSLEAGRDYFAVVEGTYTFGAPKNDNDRLADAEYSLDAGETEWVKEFSNTRPDVLDLFIDGTNPDFGAFRADHTYGTLFTGTGASANFAILDAPYNDNAGSLDVTLYECEPKSYATVVAHKIICTDEADLPNYGAGNGPKMTAETAEEWIGEEHPSCRLVPGWHFEWTANQNNDPGDTATGFSGQPWTSFGPTDENGMTSVMVPESVLDEKSKLWFREVLKDGFIPFTHEAEGGKNTDDETAEFYCHTDVLNYDNREFINLEVDETYHCVAWNVPEEQYAEVTLCKYDQNQEPLENWQLALLGEEVDGRTVVPDGSTQSLASVPAGEYVLKASGAYEYRGNTGLLADARFSERQAGDGGFGTYPYQPWREASATNGGLAVQVNLDKGELWGSVFSPSHTYYGSLSQAALSDVDFYVYDNVYNDNVGDVEVSLYTGRTGLTGEDGCMTFTEVPYGDYEIEELLQDGWTNVSGLGPVTVDEESETFNVVNTDYEQGPYCGDGVKNQAWEQCDVADDSCTDYCTFANQCSDLQLAKITLDADAPQSVSFDGTIRLGSAGNSIPNGTWFNLNETGDDEADDIAKDSEGLAVERKDGELVFAVQGNGNGRDFDYVLGNLMTLGTDLGAVNESPVVGWPLEKNTDEDPDRYDLPDVFEKTDDEGVDFEFYMTSGDDSASVAFTASDEKFDCPECKAEVEARIVLQDGEQIMTNGDGNLTPQVILGDGSTVDFGEWFKVSEAPVLGDSAEWIDDAETVTNFTNPDDLEGLFVSRDGDGKVKVGLYGYHSPGGDTNFESLRATIEFNDADVASAEEIPGDFRLENHSETDGTDSNDNFDSYSVNTSSVDFDFWVDTKADGITITLDHDSIENCDDDTTPESDEYMIDGKKYWGYGEVEIPQAGWKIELYDGEGNFLRATDTDMYGYYYFWVPEGEYEVKEVMQTDWWQVGVQDGYDYEWTDDEAHTCEVSLPMPKKRPIDEGQYLSAAVFSIGDILRPVETESDYRCDFHNQKAGEPGESIIFGHKFELTSEGNLPKSGWTIELRDGAGNVLDTTVTDENGEYTFDITEDGYYEVHELMQTDWEQVSVFQNESTAFTGTNGLEYCGFEIYDNDYVSVNLLDGDESPTASLGYTCDFVNEFTGETIIPEPEERGGGGGGTRLREPAATPLVLGESTSVSQCPFLTDHMQMGWENDSMEVMKLQLFLNVFKDMFGGTENPVTGTFGATTDANVKAFQEQYRSEILDPWFERGIVPHNRPTGFVYKTTLWKINDIICPDYAILPDFDGETLDENVDLDVNGIID